MYRVEQEEPSLEFTHAWRAAGKHIQLQGQGGVNWIRSDLNPPMAEHLSFRIGNKLFFVFVEAAEFSFAHGHDLFLKVAKEATAIPCVMPMTEQLSQYVPDSCGWGLIHAETRQSINPLELVTDELIVISDWELHDFAIQVVKSNLEKDGKNVFSSQSSLQINPSIWFEILGQAYWIVVRAARFPEKEATAPPNISDIKADCVSMGRVGYFASVGVANNKDPFDPQANVNGNFLPLYRGHGMFVRYEGLREV